MLFRWNQIQTNFAIAGPKPGCKRIVRRVVHKVSTHTA